MNPLDSRSAPVVVDRSGGLGGELVLRRDREHYEIISNGVFLMDTRNGESERLLVSAALERLPHPGHVLIGGLGVGFSVAEAAALPGGTVTVVELEPAIIEWHRTHLRSCSGGALDDPRVRVVQADLLGWLRTTSDTYDALCLDIDNGPDWTVTEGNAELYAETGLDLLARRLAPGGVLAVWSANASPAFEARLRDRFSLVEVLTVPVPRGEPDVVYLARTGP
ncbi:spermidine synthase [Actinomadura scrupuli]|uniref:spermine/spermidine synthase domain-containing protein n=1 Tax=Actinomadura scrupuli TaxID=559629 RepID=UPI003D978BA0